jgi:glycosyltransferase involved in cell wall biosynthesis
MKVILVVNNSINFKSSSIKKLGGIEDSNLQLANNLIKLGLNVKLACIIKKKIKYGKLCIIPINYLLSKKLSQFCDVLIASNTNKFFNKQKNIIKVLWLHNQMQIEKSIRKNELLSILLNKPNCVFVSKYLKNITTPFYPFKSRTVISNGCSKLFLKNKKKKQTKPIFVWTIRRSRGLSEILYMWGSYIHKKEPKAELHIYGLKNNLNKKTLQNYRNIGIKFFGIVNKKVLAKKYSYSTAMIHPGYDETFCISALEGQASGLPILTFNRTALSERVVNGVNGYKVNSFKRMAKTAVMLINNKSKRTSLSNNAIRLSKKFSWEIIAVTWYNYLRKIKYLNNK